MQYVGSKRKMKDDLRRIFSRYRKKGQLYVEPFVGGAKSKERFDNPRWGNDIHYELIQVFIALQKGWTPPDVITEEDYYYIKEHRDELHPALVGFVGFNCSFGNKYWGGYARNSEGKDYCGGSQKSILKQAPLLKGIKFTSMPYQQMKIPKNSFIYCDPPYEGTTKYKGSGSFSHHEFWEWAAYMGEIGNTVFVSEYSQPKVNGFEKVFQKEIRSTLSMDNQQKKIERLYMWTGKKQSNRR